MKYRYKMLQNIRLAQLLTKTDIRGPQIKTDQSATNQNKSQSKHKTALWSLG